MDLSVSIAGLESGVIVPIGPEGLKTWAPQITYFLTKQEASWNKFWTLEDLTLKMLREEFIPALYFRDEELQGLALISLQKYSAKIFNMRIEFLSCENFIAMTPLLQVLEERARLLGCTAIEAIAHPTIAKYAEKKHGFEAPLEFVTKKLEPIRRH